MNVIYDLKELKKPLKNPVLTIGNFDGVHKGHLSLFDRVKEISKRINGQSAVMTFEPHPIKVMKPGNGPYLITPIKQKLKLISEAGIEVIFCIPFTREFASIPAKDFIKDILLGVIGIKEVVVGYDYTFGNKRQGDTEFLRRMGEELGFKVHVVEPIYLDNTLISSTSIRDFVREGNLAAAKKLLGRDYQISGRVKKGAGRGGKLLGIPTANLLPVDELIPKRGVYAVIAILDDRNYFGVCNIGYNPTFGVNTLSIETHLLDFNDDIVGDTLSIRFISPLREEKTFHNAQELSDQIKKDIQLTKELFGIHE
jgi:riboflavin kinase/FMN adenylyltransferase